MTQDELLFFIKHIAKTSSEKKFEYVMNQLCDILEMQNADPKLVNMVRTVTPCHQDLLLVLHPKAAFADMTPEDIEIAKTRRAERLRREREMHTRYGRC